MAKTYRVLVPNDPPESGHRPVRGAEFSSKDEALADAEKRAVQVGRSGSALVEEVGTNNVWSVQYHPEDPVFLGLTAEGVANLHWPVEFRICHDPTEIEQVFDEAGNEVDRKFTGNHTTQDILVDASEEGAEAK